VCTRRCARQMTESTVSQLLVLTKEKNETKSKKYYGCVQKQTKKVNKKTNYFINRIVGT
jgi:hypothetical protein